MPIELSFNVTEADPRTQPSHAHAKPAVTPSMPGRRNRSRRRHHRAKVEDADTVPSSSYSDPITVTAKGRKAWRSLLRGRKHARGDRDLRKLLLSVIRGHYIDTISRLPTEVLTTARARGLLVAGHCYGPFAPVENIIANSLWYATAFPFRSDDPIDVAVITTDTIARLAHRSLDGLVACLRHYCPDLSHDDALCHLCLSGADLHRVAASVRGDPSFTQVEFEADPFQEVAQAAGHPKPAALALFVTSVLPTVERDALSLLAAKRTLCLQDIESLSAMLLPSPLPELEDPLPQPSPREQHPEVIRIIGERRKNLKIWYQSLLDIADAALRKFARQTGEHYHLHTIYGESIVKNEDYEVDQYVHINFMAWRNVDSSSLDCQSEAPVRFFAEADNPPTRDCPEECITLCCILPQPSPCRVDNRYACMINHKEIDHPESEMFFGKHQHKTVETENDRDFPITIDVNCRFFDLDKGIELVQFYADRVAHIEAIHSKFCSERASVNEDDTTCSKNRFDQDDTDDEDTSDEDVSVCWNRYI
ncbi:hypothetical protein PR202_ga27110 [Eleusine coracana subsp. coracana]|uniref:Uncharacterized protein n=1 Tax=Eleusine coracana subsp. coracana TaxID=191504 RepID=A0AAV5DFZ9_ELECO|nr:hypothetical protein PR202_ga27110 [Eleusine coracana subsp. coracana]